MLIEALREADRHPLTLTYHYFPGQCFPGLDLRYRQTESITEALRSYGVTDIVRRTTWVSTRMPRTMEANIQQQPANRPALVSTNLNVDQNGESSSTAFPIFAGDKVRLLIDGNRSRPDAAADD